jgi:hypothetical protein
LQPLSQTGINESNYAAWGRAYGVALDPPPLLEKIVSKSYSGAGFTAPFARNHIDLEVPSGYRAHSWNCAVLYDFLNSHSVCISIGTNQPNYLSGQFGVISANFPPNQVGEIPVSIIGDAEYFSINVHIWCVRLWTHMATWQKECFEKIMQAYFQKKSAYDQALAEAKAGYGNGYFGTNPAINRQIERNELKKGCLNALFNGLDFSSDAIGNYDSMDDCAPPMALADCCAIYEGERAKFLEQVFDWNFMSYLLYPYFHGKKCRWKKLYQLQDADPDFLKFLQAGMARVIVPVRPGFEEVAMHFLRTGQIWGGGPVPAIKSDLYLSITQEMMGAVLYAGEVVSPTWEIRVPTTLTVLQCGSACISGEGLPCDCGTGIGTGTPGTLTPGTADPVLPGSGG